MLGEDHSLVSDFPELEQDIKALTKADKSFAEDNKKYTNLDRDIRKLEMNNSPIEDDEMHRLKQERAFLKDTLYNRLTRK